MFVLPVLLHIPFFASQALQTAKRNGLAPSAVATAVSTLRKSHGDTHVQSALLASGFTEAEAQTLLGA